MFLIVIYQHLIRLNIVCRLVRLRNDLQCIGRYVLKPYSLAHQLTVTAGSV